MTELPILIHSLYMCSTGNSNCCSECHLANLEDCSLILMREAANALSSIDPDDEDYEDPDLEESDWDREMGFDPYEGLYTYDC